MIVFDLACSAGHVFEAWFGSTADYDLQRARGLVQCPLCGVSEVSKAAMAPNLAAKVDRQAVAPADSPNRAPPSPEEMKAMLRALARAQAKALEGSEHVGGRFAREARAIHDGAAEARAIHGQATVAEAKALVEDGIPVAPLPLPVAAPGTTH